MSDLYALALNSIRDQAQSLSISELHGAVVGIGVCGAFTLQSLVDLLGVDALSDENDVEAFVSASLENLFADDMSFALLLPEDYAALDARVTAIGEWTGSFLAGLVVGLGEGEAESFASLPEEVQEIVRDFSAITEIDLPGDAVAAGIDAAATKEKVAAGIDAAAAKEKVAAGIDAADPREEAEADLMQVQEFVKVGVLLVMSLLKDVPSNTTE
ncbi:MAG: UPF0149 family protein [Gammaproteobacteria bacterium]|nr:UPF0149 family protein [Gammaproteobacteria bacterium]